MSKHTQVMFRRSAKLFEPSPDLTVSQWADENRILTTETSAEPGPWRTERAPYMREIMDSVSDPFTPEIVIMSSAQVGKTEFMLNMVGYHVDRDPCPMVYMLPTKDLIESFSKQRLATMIKASPALRFKISEARSRDSSNTITEKSFPGGYIAIVGANSPAGLSSRPIRILLADEVDRYPASAGTEGDPIKLIEKRTTTFWNRKLVYASTPLLKETSRIARLYEDSTMEEWCLPCPSCGKHQPLKWAQIRFKHKMEPDGEIEVQHVDMACVECGALHNEREWKRGTGKWIARKKHSTRRGFHLNQLASPWSSWERVVKEFLESKSDPELLKVWTNTVLGETWEEDGEQLEEEVLARRAEGYAADVPNGVKVLTAAVDVQDDRLEIEVMGWGVGKESWGIRYHTIFGKLDQPQVWKELDEFLSRQWTDIAGRRFGIAITCVDSGGHYTQEVYRFCAPREHRRVYAIKGQGATDGEYLPLINGHTRTKREKAVLFLLGVDEGKTKVFRSLKIPNIGPGFCHFPIDRGYTMDYYRGLTAEKIVTKAKMGVKYSVWQKTRDRNEPLDLRVYNLAGLEILNPNLEEIHPGRVVSPAAAKKRRVHSRGVTV